jgi:hypothetical protein
MPDGVDPAEKGMDKGAVDMRGKYEQSMEHIGKCAPVSIPG